MLLLTLSDLLIFEKYENRLGDRIIKQLLNLVIAIMINNDLLATDKSQHFAQPHPKIVIILFHLNAMVQKAKNVLRACVSKWLWAVDLNAGNIQGKLVFTKYLHFRLFIKILGCNAYLKEYKCI